MIVTMKWLERYLAIKDEIKDIESRLAAIDGWKTPKLSLNPMRTNSNEGLDELIIKRNKLYMKYLKKLSQGRKIVLEIEIFIEEVKDPLTRHIIRLKYIDGLSWREVGERVHLSHVSCYQKVKSVIKN